MRNTPARHIQLALVASTLLLAALPVDGQDVVERALAYSPEYTHVLRSADGVPVALVRDLNGDGEADAALLAIAADPRVEPDAVALSDPARLYADRLVEPIFVLEAYFSGQEAIVTAELGRYPVWTGFDELALTQDPLPTAVRVRFRDRESEVTHMIVFAEGGFVSRLELPTSRNELSLVRDVNDDGRIDVVTARRVPEAGRGFETFLTLYEIGDGAFARTGSVPIVRSVSELLGRAERTMERGRWDELAGQIGFAGSPEAVLADAFPAELDPDSSGEPLAFDRFDGGVFDAVFPRVIDNPFPAPYLSTSFSLVFRVVISGEPHFYRATVGLSDNPFSGPVVAFLTGREGGE